MMSTHLSICVLLFSLFSVNRKRWLFPHRSEVFAAVCLFPSTHYANVGTLVSGSPSFVFWFSICCAFLVPLYFVFGWIGLLASSIHFTVSRPAKHSEDGGNGAALDEHSLFLKPLLLPCETKHARLFPKKHSFKYSYLLIGLPIKIRGLACPYSVQQDGDKPLSEHLWFNIDAKDYLFRSDDGMDICTKLNIYLESQGDNPSDYSFAYLVTAPKFMGYSFNPVSFWYLYDSERTLKSMILEVNNTFDERRMYLLKPSDSQHPMSIDRTETTFSAAWQKDFHVSPFNSRNGSYSLKAMEPFPRPRSTDGRISNVISLVSSKDHPKLVASIKSTRPSIDPSKLSAFSSLRFVLSWWWVGLVTYPRIVREAAKLFFKRKLHVWYRPEVAATSIGRRASKYEKSVELLFRQWLQHMVENSSWPHILIYDSAAVGEQVKMELRSNGGSQQSSTAGTVYLRPTTPLFFAQLVNAPKTGQYVAATVQSDDSSKSVIYSNNLDTAQQLFSVSKPCPKDVRVPDTSLIEQCRIHLQWISIYVLQGFRRNELDEFAESMHDLKLASEYRHAAFKLILASRMTFGFVELIDFIVWCLAVWLVREIIGVTVANIAVLVHGKLHHSHGFTSLVDPSQLLAFVS